MPSVLSVTPIEHVKNNMYTSNKGCQYYMDSAISTTRYCYSEGDLSKRQLVWARDEKGDTYIRCSACMRILRMTIAFNVIIGHHLYSINCEHCAITESNRGGCGSHTWVVLKNWVQRRLRGSIRFRPNTCPACESKDTNSDYAGFRSCRKCCVKWRVGQ